MSKSQNFDHGLSERSDQALFAMLAHSNDYRPAVIDAARNEIHRRKFSPEQLAQLEAGSRRAIAGEVARANQSLSCSARALMLFLSVPTVCAVPLIVSERYRSRGYAKKASQCLAWTGIGWLFWGSAIMVSGPHGYGLLMVPLIFIVAAVADIVVHFRRSQSGDTAS